MAPQRCYPDQLIGGCCPSTRITQAPREQTQNKQGQATKRITRATREGHRNQYSTQVCKRLRVLGSRNRLTPTYRIPSPRSLSAGQYSIPLGPCLQLSPRPAPLCALEFMRPPWISRPIPRSGGSAVATPDATWQVPHLERWGECALRGRHGSWLGVSKQRVPTSSSCACCSSPGEKG